MEPTSTSGIELQETQTAHPGLNPNPNTTEQSPTTRDQYPTGLRFIFLTIGLILSIFLAALDSSILSTAIPRITDQFGTVKDVGWYSAGYTISNAAFGSTWGRSYKFFPLLATFSSAIAIFETGNVICALARNGPTLILGRVVAGVGGGGIMNGCFIVIALSVKPALRAAYMGVLGVTFGTASVTGPLLGGFLTDGPGWRWCFWVSLPIGVLAGVLVGVTFKTPFAARPVSCAVREKLFSLDLLGACLVMGSMACFTLAMQRAAMPSQWHSHRVIIPLCSSVILLALFITNERVMGARAMIQTHLLKRRNISLNLIYQFFLGGLFFPLTYALPIQFQSVGNSSATQSGIRLIPLILGVSIFTMVANGLLTFSRRFTTPFLLLGAAVGTLGAGLVHTLGAEAGTGPWIGYELLIGFGVGIALQVPMIANQAAVGVEDMAAITSLTLFMENVGAAVFIASTEAAFTNGLVRGLERDVPWLGPEMVIDTGATRIREVFGRDERGLEGVLRSYLGGCRDGQLVPISCGAAAVLVSLCVVGRGVGKEVRKRV